MKINRAEYFNLKEIIERKWTQSKVKLWLGVEDIQIKNQFNKSYPSKLFLKERVFDIESTKKFQDWFDKSIKKREKLSITHKELNEKRKNELLNYINSLNIKIKKLSKLELFNKALNHYNNLWIERGNVEKFIYDINNCSDEFLCRISLNMLRHLNKHYEIELDKMFGKVGNYEAYILLKNKINDKIIATYPFLKYE